MRPLIQKLLLLGNTYLKTDVTYLVKGGFWLTIGKIITAFLALGLSLVLGYFLPKEVYGNYKLILSVAALLAIPTLGGMITAITQSAARTGGARLLKKITWFRFQYGLLSLVGSIGVASYYAWKDNFIFALIFLLIGIFISLIDPLDSYEPFLNGKKAFKTLTRFRIISIAISSVILGVTAIITQNLIILALVYFISWSLLRGLFFYLTLKKYQPEPDKTTDEEIANTIHYGKHLTVMNILATFMNQVDKLIIFHFLGPVQLAIYSFAIAIPEQIKDLLSTVSDLALPKFSARPDTQIIAGMNQKILRLFIISLVTVIIYIIACPYIYQLLLPKYEASVPYSQVFAISMLSFSFFPIVLYWQAKKKIKEQYYINFIAPCFQLVAMGIGAGYAGLMGLIIARVISRYFNNVLNFYYYRKITGNLS